MLEGAPSYAAALACASGRLPGAESAVTNFLNDKKLEDDPWPARVLAAYS